MTSTRHLDLELALQFTRMISVGERWTEHASLDAEHNCLVTYGYSIDG